MQKKKIVAGITAIVVLALLFAGVGYAFDGTARTYNSGDDQDLAYMSVTPSSFDPIFTGETVFDTYVYNDSTAKIAYAFNAAASDLIVGTSAYKAVELNDDDMTLTVLNKTKADITALNIELSATGVGNADFAYIFAFQIESEDPVYIVFDGSSPTTVVLTPGEAIEPDDDVDIDVTVYLGYKANVYVPANYIGPATAVAYEVADAWAAGVVYYTNNAGAAADPQPTSENFGESTYYKVSNEGHPYIQTANPLLNLEDADFGIKVTDATPASP